jgi:hypothetical protein
MKFLHSGTVQLSAPRPSPKIPEGAYDVDIVEYDNGVCCVMMSERKDNKGASLTNACDRIAAEVYRTLLPGFPPDRIVWLEHYPARKTERAHIDLVQFQSRISDISPEGTKIAEFTNPQWKRIYEAKQLAHREFLTAYGNILKELCTAHFIFIVEDKSGYHWRVGANEELLFIIASNPSAELPCHLLTVDGTIEILKKNSHFFSSGINMEEQFTAALMKGFLNKGL